MNGPNEPPNPPPSPSPNPPPNLSAAADGSVLDGSHTPDGWSVELCACPECGLPAEVVDDGRGADLVGVRCVGKHWFFGLRQRLVA
jgi:hypothetical protein